MTNRSAYENIVLICVLSSIAMIGNFFVSIITGPQLAHYINIAALSFTLIAVWILIKNKLFKSKRSIVNIIVSLSIGLLAASLKYGYTGWHYVNLVTLSSPN